jgi:hypothetical protein
MLPLVPGWLGRPGRPAAVPLIARYRLGARRAGCGAAGCDEEETGGAKTEDQSLSQEDRRPPVRARDPGNRIFRIRPVRRLFGHLDRDQTDRDQAAPLAPPVARSAHPHPINSPDVIAEKNDRPLLGDQDPWRLLGDQDSWGLRGDRVSRRSDIIFRYRFSIPFWLRATKLVRIGAQLGVSLPYPAFHRLNRSGFHRLNRSGFRGRRRFRHDDGRRGNRRDGRARGIEDDAFRPFLVGMNPDHGPVDARTGNLGHRQRRQAGIGDQQKRKQHATNEDKITREWHFLRFCSIRTAARHGDSTGDYFICSWLREKVRRQSPVPPDSLRTAPLRNRSVNHSRYALNQSIHDLPQLESISPWRRSH